MSPGENYSKDLKGRQWAGFHLSTSVLTKPHSYLSFSPGKTREMFRLLTYDGKTNRVPPSKVHFIFQTAGSDDHAPVKCQAAFSVCFATELFFCFTRAATIITIIIATDASCDIKEKLTCVGLVHSLAPASRPEFCDVHVRLCHFDWDVHVFPQGWMFSGAHAALFYTLKLCVFMLYFNVLNWDKHSHTIKSSKPSWSTQEWKEFPGVMLDNQVRWNMHINHVKVSKVINTQQLIRSAHLICSKLFNYCWSCYLVPRNNIQNPNTTTLCVTKKTHKNCF